MSQVKALGYIGCAVSDIAAWDELLNSVFGIQKRNDSPEKDYQYRIDDYHHRLTLHESKKDKLEYLGWEVATQEDLDALVHNLADKGVEVKRADANTKDHRAVHDLYIVTGPDNVRNELFFGPLQDSKAVMPGSRASGFNTGELGMGHVVLAASQRDETISWYLDMFGLRLSDHIHWDGIEATFLHCNPRHHSIALVNCMGPIKGGDLGHFMLESNSIDDIGRAYDTALEKKIPVAFTYGKHTNDKTTSFYLYSPSGWLVEYGYGGILIDDDSWESKLYDSPKIWGHVHQPPPDNDQEAASRH